MVDKEEVKARFHRELPGWGNYGWETVRSGGCCEYCGDDVVFDRHAYAGRQHNHLLPRKYYGDCEFVDWDENIVSACFACHSCKRDFDALDPDNQYATKAEKQTALSGQARNSLKNARQQLIDKVRQHIKPKRDQADSDWKKVQQLVSEYFPTQGRGGG